MDLQNFRYRCLAATRNCNNEEEVLLRLEVLYHEMKKEQIHYQIWSMYWEEKFLDIESKTTLAEDAEANTEARLLEQEAFWQEKRPMFEENRFTKIAKDFMLDAKQRQDEYDANRLAKQKQEEQRYETMFAEKRGLADTQLEIIENKNSELEEI